MGEVIFAGVRPNERMAYALEVSKQVLDLVGDDGEIDEIPEYLLPEFRDAALVISAVVDARVTALKQIDARKDFLTDLKKDLDIKINALDKMKDRVLERTKMQLETVRDVFPKGIEGTFAKLRLQNNAQAPVEYLFCLESLGNIVNPADKWRIPNAYLEEKTVLVFDKKRFDKDLKENDLHGGDVAVLGQRGTHVRYK